jgi:hypothetical protein
MSDRPAEPDLPSAAEPDGPEVFARLRIEAERTPDGRAILYFSWPGLEAGPAADEQRDV